jgi:hypothetical protein
MIAKILVRINKGTCTKDALSQELGIRKRIIEEALSFMHHEGFLEEITCNSRCGDCPMNCVTTNVKMYTITQKGINHIKNEERKKIVTGE